MHRGDSILDRFGLGFLRQKKLPGGNTAGQVGTVWQRDPFDEKNLETQMIRSRGEGVHAFFLRSYILKA